MAVCAGRPVVMVRVFENPTGQVGKALIDMRASAWAECEGDLGRGLLYYRLLSVVFTVPEWADFQERFEAGLRALDVSGIESSDFEVSRKFWPLSVLMWCDPKINQVSV